MRLYQIISEKVFTKVPVQVHKMSIQDVSIFKNPTPNQLKQLALNSMNQRHKRGENVGGDPWLNGYVDGEDDALRGCEDIHGNYYFVDAWWMTHGDLNRNLQKMGIEMTNKRIFVSGDGVPSI